MALGQKGQLEEAIRHFQEATKGEPTVSALAHYNLGITLREKGELEEAIRHFQESIQLEPKASAMAHIHLGNALREKGQLDEAIGHYQKAIPMDPKLSALAHYCLGLAVRDKGQLKKAIDHLKQTVQLDPGFNQAYAALAWTFAAGGDWARAADCYAQVRKRSPTDDGHFWFEYAAVSLLSGDRPGYARACAQMIDKCGKPNGPRAYHVVRACTLAAGAVADLSLPARLAEKELKDNAREFWSLTERGALAYRAGHYQEAVSFFEKSLEADSRPGRAVVNWLWLALARQRLGKAEEARRWLDKATAWLDPYRDGMPDRADELGLHLHNWLEAQVLRREAEALIRPAEKR
jgi:tetratricopeptide (TPR) repeat protein